MTRLQDSTASLTSSRWLHVSLFAMETIGTVILYWKVVPLYRQLSADPTAYRARGGTALWSLSAIALIQVGYWVRYRIGPVPPRLASSALGHIVVFLSRIVFVLATGVFSYLFISQELASEMPVHRYVLTTVGLFSLFLYSQELQWLGNALIRREKNPVGEKL
jgi:hypothetical protein